MNYIIIFDNNIFLNSSIYDIYTNTIINTNTVLLTQISFKLQNYNLYLCLYPGNKSYIHFDKNVDIKYIDYDKDNELFIKRIKYASNFTLKTDIIYLNFYFIYTIKKYYLHKQIRYFFGLSNSIKSYKIFNTMNLYKVVALI